MTSLTNEQVHAAIAGVQDKYLEQDYVSAKALKALSVQGDTVTISIELGYPCAGVEADIKQSLTDAVKAVGAGSVKVEITSQVAAHQVQGSLQALKGVKNIVAVSSGKGGVGKSTTTVNLALAMAAEGARVGIMDADIYGPSQGMMLGVTPGTRPQPVGEKLMAPIQAHGLQVMSIGFLIDDEQPMVWRGPMASGALQQLLTETVWEDLDYLFIDMPPGTGDIQLTLSQKVPVTGSVIVTTPQDIALLDAKKGIEMFRKVEIPVLGVVENMSLHICSECGHSEPIFGHGGGELLAEQYQSPMLGALPLTMGIRTSTDNGAPTVVSAPDSQETAIYRDMARKVGALLAKRAEAPVAMPNISIVND
ncbi:iron-sulfur cluster carrier protein ApbC [Aliamphritea ceti]|uniref:iron-sulfur cluster carrier protein ApbC n=1 Tax=Aliamphritea ceti TaxID=1524258 RepID=UPI0021C37393|nr:iron-sulfur cluster carrier protein ApbC [Aliamphritea ceti]